MALSPAWLVYGLALLVADLRMEMSPQVVKDVHLAVRELFGDYTTEKQRTAIVRRYFRTYVCEWVDAMRLHGDGRALKKLLVVSGTERLLDALSKGRGAVVYAGHYGSPRPSPAMLSLLGFPTTIVATWTWSRQGRRREVTSIPRAVWGLIEQHFKRPNIKVGKQLTNLAVAVKAAAVLRQNEVVVSMMDAPPRSAKELPRTVSVDFLRGKANVIPGTVVLARTAQSPLLTLTVRRLPDWRHVRVEIGAEVPTSGDATLVLGACLARLEREIRTDPGQWKYLRMKALARLGLATSKVNVRRVRD